MADEPNDKDGRVPAPLLEYQTPVKAGVNVGCLIVSILMAGGAGLLALIAMVLFGELGGGMYSGILIAGTVVIVVAAVVAKRFGLNAALAIALAAACVFLLTFGLCSGTAGSWLG